MIYFKRKIFKILFVFLFINCEFCLNSHADIDHNMIDNVNMIFNQVRSVADKKANRFPELEIIPQKGIRAYVQEDGLIRITHDAIKFCCDNVDKNIGNTRLAFIFGHEMAHLANDDFWEYPKQIDKYDFGTKSKEKIADNDLIKKEFKADAYGILYAFLAGFNPKTIIKNQNKSFIHKWEKHCSDKQPTRHPKPDDRQKQLQEKIDEIMNSLDLYNIGVRLYQIGRYKEALEFLNRFRIKFPSREVFNNLGLIHYQIAIKALSGFQTNRVFQFKLATVLDPESIAGKYRGTQSGKSVFEKHISQSIRFLKHACNNDLNYIPSRINLSSAYIMKGRYSGAEDILKEALKIDALYSNKSFESNILNNLAIVKYIRGKLSNEKDMYEASLKQLKEIINNDKNYVNGYYNIGSILKENNNYIEYKHYWNQFLEHENTGVYANIVKKDLGVINISKKKQFILPIDYISIPVNPGDSISVARKRLSGFSRRFLDKYNLCEYFFSNNTKVLALDYVVIYVEKCLNNNKKSFHKKHQPVRTFTNTSGKMTYVYDHFAVDVRNNSIIQTIVF